MPKNTIDTFVQRAVTSVTLAPAAVITIDDTFCFGKSDTNYGCDWDITSSAAVNIRMDILQSNEQNGPFIMWSNPSADGINRFNPIPITTSQDGCSLNNQHPSGYFRLRFTNLGTAPATINRLTLFLQ